MRSPRSTSGEEVIPRLRLAAVAPPVLARVGLLYLIVGVGLYRRKPRQELVVAAGQGLPRVVELHSSQASSRGGPVSPLGTDVAGDPLVSGARPGLGG